MSLLRELDERSGSKCELCSSNVGLEAYLVAPQTEEVAQNQVATCSTCRDQIKGDMDLDSNHWRCLNESMWSEIPAVQVMAYRMLNKFESENWAQSLLDMMYMDDKTMEWAVWKPAEKIVHRDVNGHVLENGDSVTLVKDLQVKGTGSFKAKQGTHVRRIRLDPNNANYIEGKVEGQDIVIITDYVKKSK